MASFETLSQDKTSWGGYLLPQSRMMLLQLVHSAPQFEVLDR
jgi:hypothetical protein